MDARARHRGARTGDILAGKYLLEECLGVGGFGEVYRATNVSLGRKVAIKLLDAQMASNEDDVLRFLREARAGAAVRHAHVVDVLDVARDEDGTPFIVQELLSGEDLERYAVARGGRLSVEEILALMVPVVEALAVAHERGVVHRDLKPANVFLARADEKIVPKILDFGACLFATMAGDGAAEMRMAIGTPHYMAPEQVAADPVVDARADVWAVGVILWELTVGEVPFEAPTAQEILRRVQTRDVPRLESRVPDVPKAFADLVASCTQRDVAVRPANGRALLARMRTVSDDLRSRLHGRRPRLGEGEQTPPEGVEIVAPPGPPVAIELDTSVPSRRASSPDLGQAAPFDPRRSSTGLERASRASYASLPPSSSTRVSYTSLPPIESLPPSSTGRVSHASLTPLTPLSSTRPAIVSRAPAASDDTDRAIRVVDWSRLARPAGLAFAGAAAVHGALWLAPALTSPLGAALRGDSLVASGAVAVTVLALTALLVTRAVATGGKPRSLAFTTGAGVVLSMTMIIVTFAASEAELGASSPLGLVPFVAPLLPFGLALLALRRFDEARAEHDRSGSRWFLALAGLAMLVALESGPTGAVRRAPQPGATHGAR